MTCLGLGLALGQAHAQSTEPVVAFPIYNAAQAMQGLHQHTLLPRAQAFADAAQALSRQTTA